jgi:hypothetical protein
MVVGLSEGINIHRTKAPRVPVSDVERRDIRLIFAQILGHQPSLAPDAICVDIGRLIAPAPSGRPDQTLAPVPTSLGLQQTTEGALGLPSRQLPSHFRSPR